MARCAETGASASVRTTSLAYGSLGEGRLVEPASLLPTSVDFARFRLAEVR
jgi:hypothetical protein